MKPAGKTDEIAHQLRGFIEEHVCAPHRWYVGLACEAEEKLFQHHHVNRQRDSWIYRRAVSPEAARSVHEDFLKLGCDGDRHANECEGTIIYIYLKSRKTKP